MLILKQNAANSVPTPPAGKGTIFLDDSDTLSVKTSDGNVETFPTVAAANTQVVFIDGTALSGNANFVYTKNTDTLTLSGTLAAGNVKTNNLQYANGVPWDLSDPGGSNTEIQFNDDESFGGSAAFTFNKSTNAVSMGGALTVTGNASAGNISTGGVLSVTGNANVGNLGTGGLIVATGNVTGGNLVTTGTGSVGELAVSGNAVITGNLAVNGNVTYVNVDTLQVEDPVISLGGGPNGAPLTSNDGKDRGTLLNYYTTSAIDAFMGWDSSNSEFSFGSNVTIVNDVVTFNTLGNVRVGNIIGNGQALTGLAGANVTGQVGNALVAGTVYTAAQPNITSVGTLTGLGVNGNITGVNVSANTGAFYGNAAGLTNIPGGNIVGNISGNISNANYAAFTGQVVDATQSNITALGKLTSLLAGTDAASADFTNATVIAAKGNSGVTSTASVGLVGEGVSTDSGNSSAEAIGLFGIGSANGSAKGTGVQGTATVKATGDTGAAVGVRGVSSATHAGGYNIGVLGNAAGSGVGNYAFYVQSGDIASIEANTIWDLYDNSSGALSFNSSGKAGILAVSTVDSAEGVSMSGTLSVTGNITATAGIKTDNYFYANGSPVDFQQAGGSNTQIQFNDADSFGGSAAFTFNKTSNVVTMSGNLSVANIQATGDVTTATLTSNGNANVGNLGTGGLIVATGNVTGGNLTTAGVVAATGNVSGGNLTTAGVVSATGNVTGGNLTTAGVVAATGNVSGGNLTTGGVVAATGNVSGGNLTTAGALSVTGNANVGNLGTGGLIVATGNVTGGNLTTAGALSVTGNANVGNIGVTHVVVTGNVTGNLLPSANITYDLGSDTQRWRDLYLAGNTIKLGTQTINSNATSTQVSGVLNANGSGLFALNASNLSSGTVPSGRLSGNYTINALGWANTVADNAQPNITSVGTLTSLTVTGNASAGNLSTGGTLSVTGNANVGNIGATGVVATTLGGTLTTAAQPNITSVGTLTGLGVNGNITAANITANTGVFTGNGSGLSQLAGGNVTGQVANALVASTVYTNAQPNITSVGTLTSVAVTGNATAGNVYANSGTIGAANLTGTLTTAAQPNITSVGTLSSLSVTGNVAAGNLTTVGILSVTGTGTSSIAGNLDMTSNNIINLAEPVNASDAATKAYVDSVAEGLHTHDSCNAATQTTLATISGGTVTYNNGTSGVGATLTTTGSYTTIDGVTLSNGMRILVKNEANAAHNGIYDRTSTTVLTRSSDFDTPTEMAGGDFTFVTAGTLYDNTGWVMTDPVTTVGTTNVNWTQFSGAGTYTAGTGLTLTGTQFSVNVAQPTITSLGTLTGLAVNGNITAANITANTGVFTGNGSGLSAIAGGNVTGQVANALVAGTVYTAAQPNITSVGTLSSLSVTGNVSAGNVSGTLLTGTLATAAQPNVTSLGTLTSLGVNGTVTAVAFTANTGVFTGNGSGLSALAGGNVTGQVANALVAGTVYTAAQPNITSVGTLTGLGVNGNITAANITANTGVFTGNGSGLSAIAGANVTGTVSSATTAGTVTTAAQPNITSVGTLTGLTLAANADITMSGTGSNINGVALVSATLFEGSGANLTTLNASNISSGTLAQARLANASLTVNGTSIALGASGTITANTTNTLTLGTYLTGTSFNGGAAVTAAVDATSAATASKVVARDTNGSFSANVITANSFVGAASTSGTVTTAAQPNITSVGQLTSLAVTGNITANNFNANSYFVSSVNAAVSAAGTVQGNATALTKMINVTSTVASGAGVALPTAVAGMRISLINTAANAVLVYPASGGAINALATNAAYSLAAGGRLDFVSVSTTQWYTMGAAYS